jgi:cysteinyl-tRNA synthetase
MLHLYNSLIKEKEPFKPLKEGLVTMYNCGPTVYDFVHIGNLRSFLFADLLRRYLEYSGYQVRQVMNITDVGHALADEDTGEDKIEAAAEKEKLSPYQIARKYEKAFFEDIGKLNIRPAWKYPRATEHITEMIEIIKKLFKNGYAYVGKDNSVYFEVEKFKNYGELSGNRLENLMAGARIEVNPAKKNPFDFALWIVDPKHIMQWDSPWGRGYPGWHIECSAMSMKYLGNTIDVHTGGEDNKFPHHEAEIAQSEGATNSKFVRFWLHVKHLLVDGEKMSKSKGNFYTLNDILEKEYSARAVRYLLLSAHYRDDLNFTFESLKAAANSLRRLDEFYSKLFKVPFSEKIKGIFWIKNPNPGLRHLIQETREDFQRAMDDDLNVPKALAVIFGFINRVSPILPPHSPPISPKAKQGELEGVRKLLNEFDKVLGLGLRKIGKVAIPKEIQELLKQREQARQEKNWQKSDEIRKEIEEKGFLVEDTAEGSKIKQK